MKLFIWLCAVLTYVCQDVVCDPITKRSQSSGSDNFVVAANNVVLGRFDDIVKSESDHRLYRGIKLKNGLNVLIISDNKTDKSAASLSVGVGQINEPKDIPGLAHFLEHMLFMGSKKYPEENAYFKYLSEHNGASNAFTAEYLTNYHFDVDPQHFVAALDRFAQFFIAPLFSESAINREIKAVNSEYERNIPIDLWRIEQVKKTTSAPDHDYNSFGIGNTETLDKVPKKNGINLRERLIEFYHKEYSANIMALTILGKESLNELERMAVDIFSDIKDKHAIPLVYTQGPYGPDQLKKAIYLIPVKDIRRLEIYFPVPDATEFYTSMPLSLISHLIGHEGYRSLHSLLRKEGLINGLATSPNRFARGIAEFFISLDLTEKAMKYIDNIVTYVFQYIELLKTTGIPKSVFEERKKMSTIEFQYKDNEDPKNYATRLSAALLDYPFKDILTADSILQEWKPDLIKKYLKYLEPENMRMFIVSKGLEEKVNLKERWFGTKYGIEEIKEETIQKWKKPTLNSALGLPMKNKFVPENLKLLPVSNDVTKYPKIIYNSSISRIWFKQDNEYLLPKNVITMEILSPLAYTSPKHSCLIDLFTHLFRDSLNEAVYPASLAGLHWSIASLKYSIVLTVSGYSEKLPLLLKMIFDNLKSFEVANERFMISKDNVIRELKNHRADQPTTHATIFMSNILSEKSWTKNEILEACLPVNKTHVKAFVTSFFSEVFIQALIHGNCDKQCANNVIGIIESHFRHVRPVLSQQLIPSREIILNDGTAFSFSSKHTSHDSSAVYVYYQTGVESTRNNAVNNLFSQIVSEPCFNVLRTQEQLGYVVHSGVRRHNGIQGFGIIVQSDRHPLYVESRIEAFVESLKTLFDEMTNEQFELFKTSVIMSYLIKPKQMGALTSKFFAEIVGKYYNFDRSHIEANAVRDITKNDLTNFYNEHINANSKRRRSVAVRIVSDISKPQVDNIIDKTTNIEDITAFKSLHSLGPLPQPYINVPPVGVAPKL